MKDTVPSAFNFEATGFDLKITPDNFRFLPYSKVLYIDFTSNESSHLVSISFGTTFHEVLNVVCETREEAVAFYQKIKQELKFWQH